MSIVATRMQELRRKSPAVYEQLFKIPEAGAMRYYLDQTNMPNGLASNELKRATPGSMGNTVKVPVLIPNSEATVGSSRLCVVPNNETSSALVGLSWVTLFDSYNVYPGRYLNNELTYLEHFAANYQDMKKRLVKKIDALCVADLATYKSAVVNDTLNYTFSSNTVAAGWNDRENLLDDLAVMQDSNNFGGHLNLIGNYGLRSLIHRLGQYGTYNEKNLTYELGNKTAYVTGQLANADNQFCTMYAVPDGQVAILQRLDRESYMRMKGVPGTEWDQVVIPGIDGLTFGHYYYIEKGNAASATSEDDETCTEIEHFAFSIDLAFLHAYNPDTTTIPQPVIKAQLASGSNGRIEVDVMSMPE